MQHSDHTVTLAVTGGVLGFKSLELTLVTLLGILLEYYNLTVSQLKIIHAHSSYSLVSCMIN